MKWVEGCELAPSVHLSLSHARSHLLSHSAADIKQREVYEMMCVIALLWHFSITLIGQKRLIQ